MHQPPSTCPGHPRLSVVSRSVEFTVGAFYAINSDTSDFSEGFCIAKCLKSNLESFNGQYLEKYGEVEDNLVFYREIKEKGRFASETVNSMLVSITPVENCIGRYSIHKEELEQIILSLE